MLQINNKKINNFKCFYKNNPQAILFIDNIIQQHGSKKAGLLLSGNSSLPFKIDVQYPNIFSLDGQSLSYTYNLDNLPNATGYQVITSPKSFYSTNDLTYCINLQLSGTYSLGGFPIAVGVTSNFLTYLAASYTAASANGFYVNIANSTLYANNAVNKIIPKSSFDTSTTALIPMSRSKICIVDNGTHVGFGNSVNTLDFIPYFTGYSNGSLRWLSFIIPTVLNVPASGSLTINMIPTQ